MTSHLSGLKTVDEAHYKPSPLSYQQPSSPFSRPHISCFTGDSRTNDGANALEPVSKRQKLEGKPLLASKIALETRKEDCVQDCASEGLVQHPLELTADKKDPAQAADADNLPSVNQKLPTAQTRTLPPFPVRPCITSRKSANCGETLAIERAAVKHVVQVKPYIPEPPSLAPRYHGGSTADYYPWAGNHSEDILNEMTTKQGFYDKGQVPHNETSTARPSVWSSLKHKSGLQVLSSLLISALDQRQIHGTITANCTFKPPPRVTLTDAKREAWLRDLANPTITLRRLSRTIPHGIRGKVLLDHCLTKDIPIARAVWLAKCVGANEIRAFKRKGASGAFAIGGEAKWIRDWTVNVQNFVEGIVGDCGMSAWKSRMSYCLQLVSHIYFEHLLDRDQYLEWVVASFQSSDLHIVAVWLLIVQLNWKEILRYRQRGRRLAEGLLNQLYKASRPSVKDAFAEVFQQLLHMLRSLILSAPLCFLLRNWSKHELVLKNYLQGQEDLAFVQYECLSRRNHRLAQPRNYQDLSMEQSSQQRLIAFLDDMPAAIDIRQISDACKKIVPDQNLLITTCLNWATNIFRNGRARIYIVVRLLRRWAKFDVDLDSPILTFLSTNLYLPQRQRFNLYRLLAELVRSNHFSVSRYLQWLMARGRLSGQKYSDQSAPCDVQLLFELPLHGLPSHVVNLRRILLSSIGASTAKEDEAINAMKGLVAGKIQDFFPASETLAFSELQDCYPCRVSETVRSAIGRWIRQAIATRFLSLEVDDRLDLEKNEGVQTRAEANPLAGIGLEQFQSMRAVLEGLEDFSILADIIKICCTSENAKILTAATDTVNYHIDIFMAIGAVDELFQALYQRFQETYNQKAFERILVESLADLGAHLPKAMEEVRTLRRALLHQEKLFSPAACSPISDHAAEALQSTELAFADEVEQALSSGTSMDQNTLRQIFLIITKRLESSWTDAASLSTIKFPDLFLRLKRFGPDTFKELISQWLDNLFIIPARPQLSKILLPFICTAAISLRAVLDRMITLMKSTLNTINTAAISLDGLELLMMADLHLPLFIATKEYRLHVQQLDIIKNSSVLTVPILRAAVEACSDEKISVYERARALIKRPQFENIIMGLLQQYSKDPEAIHHAFGVGLWESTVVQVIDGLCYPSAESVMSGADFHIRVSNILDHVNDFNIPLCQLKLRAVFAATNQSALDAANILFKIVLEKARVPGNAVADLWGAVIWGLPLEHALHIRERAEKTIIFGPPKDSGSMLDSWLGLMEALVAVVTATTAGVRDFGMPPIVVQVAERISGLLLSSKTAGGLPREVGSPATTVITVMSDSLHLYLATLLRLLIVHQGAVQCARLPENSLIHLFVILSLLLTHYSLDCYPSFCELILDVLAILTDTLTEEVRSQCVRVLRDQHRLQDPRLLFLFGYSESVNDEWLQLMTGASLSGSAATSDEPSAGTTDSTQQFLLRKWELMQDTTPLITENDTSLSLTLFGARKTLL